MNARLVETSSKGGDNISTTNHTSLSKDVRFTLEIRYMDSEDDEDTSVSPDVLTFYEVMSLLDRRARPRRKSF
jgi:hypothetical protein